MRMQADKGNFRKVGCVCMYVCMCMCVLRSQSYIRISAIIPRNILMILSSSPKQQQQSTLVMQSALPAATHVLKPCLVRFQK